MPGIIDGRVLKPDGKEIMRMEAELRTASLPNVKGSAGAVLDDVSDCGILSSQRERAREEAKKINVERRLRIADLRLRLKENRLLEEVEGSKHFRKLLAEKLGNEKLVKKHSELLEADDERTQAKVLDMAYDLKGLKAPKETRNMNLNLNRDINDLPKERRDEIDKALGAL